jgi:putative oxidoreductase
MPAPLPLRRAAALALAAAAALAFLPPLLTRLVIGQAFFFAGRGKLQNAEATAAFFADLGIPFPAANAAFVSRLEYYGGLLLVVGLATRLVAAGLASTMVVALATADRQAFLDSLRGVGDKILPDHAAFAYLLFLLWLVVFGPGAVSLDALVKRWLTPAGAVEPAGP